jgi:hypothetical protein
VSHLKVDVVNTVSTAAKSQLRTALLHRVGPVHIHTAQMSYVDHVASRGVGLYQHALIIFPCYGPGHRRYNGRAKWYPEIVAIVAVVRHLIETPKVVDHLRVSIQTIVQSG